MILRDMNQSWAQPEGYQFVSLVAVGGFLVATFSQNRDTSSTCAEHRIAVYLNYMGREVSRTEELYERRIEPRVQPLAPLARKFRFRNAIYLVLEGLQELIKCLSM